MVYVFGTSNLVKVKVQLNATGDITGVSVWNTIFRHVDQVEVRESQSIASSKCRYVTLSTSSMLFLLARLTYLQIRSSFWFMRAL